MAISRYGIRLPPNVDHIVAECRERGSLIRGGDVERFERSFAAYLGHGSAIATSYGRMAFYHILKALNLPPGSEIVVPALTFWVIPELARQAGLRPVFADVDPVTFTLSPRTLERAITSRTSAVVPTHLYGLPCDMDPIVDISRAHGIAVIEDCAHALGATYRGRPVGTLGDAALFSFQTLKPLNAFGGGMAVVSDPRVAARVREQVDLLPWPSEARVLNRLKVGRAQRLFTRPSVFTLTAFPILWACSWVDWSPDVYLWESIRRLDPLPSEYLERFPNVQAAIGLAALPHLAEWTARTRSHAAKMNDALKDLPDVRMPSVPDGRTHAYYQYCAYVPDRDRVVARSIRRGIDIETLHVDVCTELPLFADLQPADAPSASLAAGAIQIPVYESLSDDEVARVARVVRRAIG